jgi:tetratricopeptide (TPR) repeat protein
MAANFNRTILVVCGNDKTWNTTRAAIAKGIPNIELSRTFEIAKLVESCKEKKPVFLIIDWNAYDPGEIAVALQQLRGSARTANCPVVFLMTCPTDVQSLAMATEYDAKGIVNLSELSNSIAPLAQNIFNELAKPDSMQSFLSKISRSKAQNATGELDMAVLDFYATYPKDLNAQLEYTNYCMRYGDWKKAKDIINSIDQGADKNPRFLNIKARLLLKEKRYEEAARVIGQTQLMSPNNASRLALLGDVFLAKGKNAEAREKYQSALTIMENCRDAKRSLAQLDIAEGVVNDALSMLRDSSTEEEMGSFFNDLAIVAMHEGRSGDAHALYGSALSVLKKAKLRARIHFNVGIAHYKTNNIAAATDAFHCALQDDPVFERANTARTLLAAGATGAAGAAKAQPIWAPEEMPTEVSLRDPDEDDEDFDTVSNEILPTSTSKDLRQSEINALAQFGSSSRAASTPGSGKAKSKPKLK